MLNIDKPFGYYNSW